MGCGMEFLKWLDERGAFPPRARVLDIGESNLRGASTADIRGFVSRHPGAEACPDLARVAEEFAYRSDLLGHPTMQTLFLSEVLDLTDLEYVALDIVSARRAHRFDLNCHSLAADKAGTFDVALNFGTAEHVMNQFNTFKVMHEAVRAGGLMFHQVPATGYINHGYFCYNALLFRQLAEANDYEVEDLWFCGPQGTGNVLVNAADLPGVADATKPQNNVQGFRDSPVPNSLINVLLRKGRVGPFRTGLDVHTSAARLHHQRPFDSEYIDRGTATGMSARLASESSGPRAPRPLTARLLGWLGDKSDAEPAHGPSATEAPQAGPEPTASAPSAKPGRPLARVVGVCKKLARRLAHAVGLEVTSKRRIEAYEIRLQQAVDTLERTRSEYESRLAQRALDMERVRASQRDTRELLAQTRKALGAMGQERPPAVEPEQSLDAEVRVARGRALQSEGNVEAAVAEYGAALDLIHRYEPARRELAQLALRERRQGMALRDKGELAQARAHLVRAVELDPSDRPARDVLDSILRLFDRRDLTRQCFIYHDPVRGEQVYREAFLRALEYVAADGIVGDVLEFGVLGGFTARILAETMRDLLVVKRLHLFDSFDGLPEYDSPVDADSYDVSGRKLWADRMRFPDSVIDSLGEPIDQHIFSRLCDVLSPERIFVCRGFFGDTLKSPPPVRAALIHIDCDLYQSTREVLTRLFEAGILQDGCVLLFDDYNCFKASPDYGERRAFREFLDGQERFEATPFFTYGFNGAAFFLHERPAFGPAPAPTKEKACSNSCADVP